MAKYQKKPVVVDAVQFNYVDNIDGPETCKLAESLGLVRNEPQSLLWELKTTYGFSIVHAGSWVVTGMNGNKFICDNYTFKSLYEIVDFI